MNKKIIIIFILISLASFSYGISAGHYQIFPFSILSEIKNSNYDSSSNIDTESYKHILSINDQISFQNDSDIENTRQSLIQYIWNDVELPTTLPSKFELNINDNKFSELNNLERIDSFITEMEYGITSKAYLFLAEDTNEKLILYHQGHNAKTFEEDIPIIQNFLNENYSVLIFSMPGIGINEKPIINHEKFGTLKLNSHHFYRYLDTENFNSFSLFVEPVILTLNQIENDYSFEKFSMIGLSGGGWTTLIVSSIDERISQSYSVAGSFPIWLRVEPQNYGDFEQSIPEFYNIANFEELYFLSTYGDQRSLLLFYNEFDPCCFSGEIYEKFPFGDVIKTKLSKFTNNEFDVIIDYGQTEHKLSDYTLEIISEHIENNS